MLPWRAFRYTYTATQRNIAVVFTHFWLMCSNVWLMKQGVIRSRYGSVIFSIGKRRVFLFTWPGQGWRKKTRRAHPTLPSHRCVNELTVQAGSGFGYHINAGGGRIPTAVLLQHRLSSTARLSWRFSSCGSSLTAFAHAGVRCVLPDRRHIFQPPDTCNVSPVGQQPKAVPDSQPISLSTKNIIDEHAYQWSPFVSFIQ